MRLCRLLALVSTALYLVGCATVAPPPPPPPRVTETDTDAASYRTAADAPRILEAIDRRLAARSQTAGDLSTHDLGIYSGLLLAAGRLAEADQALLILLDRVPGDRDTLKKLALVAGARGDLKTQELRIAALEKAFPGDADVAGLRAQFLEARGDGSGAKAAWTQVLATKEDPTALEGLAGLALNSKKPAEALALATRAVTVSPDDDQAWSLRAQAKTDLGDYTAARKDLDQALALAPDDPWHRLDRGKLIWLHLYDPEAARADLEFAVAKDPSNFYSWELLGEVFEELDRPRQAYDAYLRALSIQPDYRFAYPSAAMLSFRYQDFGRAAAFAREAALDHPAEYAFPFVEALSLRALGQAEASRAVLEKARPRFDRGTTVDEMFRFLLTPGSDYYLNTAMNLEKQENVRLRLRFYQGCSYALEKSVASARAAFEEVGDSTLKKIPEIAAARDWLDHGL